MDASLIISIATAIGALFGYLAHDRKIKRQETKINDYQLKKNAEEEAEKKKALICAQIKKEGKGWNLEICNTGKSIAKNISFESKDIQCEDSGILLLSGENDFPCPYLNAGEKFEIPLALFNGGASRWEITFKWEDDFHLNNERKQFLQA